MSGWLSMQQKAARRSHCLFCTMRLRRRDSRSENAASGMSAYPFANSPELLIRQQCCFCHLLQGIAVDGPLLSMGSHQQGVKLKLCADC